MPSVRKPLNTTPAQYRKDFERSLRNVKSSATGKPVVSAAEAKRLAKGLPNVEMYIKNGQTPENLADIYTM